MRQQAEVCESCEMAPSRVRRRWMVDAVLFADDDADSTCLVNVFSHVSRTAFDRRLRSGDMCYSGSLVLVVLVHQRPRAVCESES